MVWIFIVDMYINVDMNVREWVHVHIIYLTYNIKKGNKITKRNFKR